MLSTIISLFMCVSALLGLALVLPSAVRTWRTVPFYYNLARLGLPVLALGYFGPNLFMENNFPGRSNWISGLFLFGLFLIIVAIAFYMYREPGDSYRRQIANRSRAPKVQPEHLAVHYASRDELNQAGRIFAEAFHHSFDLDFGTDRAKNGRLLAELLASRPNEVLVAVVPDSGLVVGALWLDLNSPENPPMTTQGGLAILRRYLNPLNAFYYAFFALPTVMAKRASYEHGYIQWLGIDPAWQGRGVGQPLVEKAIELSRAAGKAKVILHTERSNFPARRLYTRLGFQDQTKNKFSPRLCYVRSL
jgi:ribosomal protein S18 acetylase RimI-like enzyme